MTLGVGRRLRRWWHGNRHDGYVGTVEGGAYMAVCDCGWQSPERATEKEMRADAREHWGGRAPRVDGTAAVRFARRYPDVTRALFFVVPAVVLVVVLARSHGDRLRNGLVATAFGIVVGAVCMIVGLRRPAEPTPEEQAGARRRAHLWTAAAFVLLGLLSVWKPGTGVAFACAWLAAVFGVVFWRGLRRADPPAA